MKNLLLLLILANVLYFIWGRFQETPPEPGIVLVDESELGPLLVVSRRTENSTSNRSATHPASARPSGLAASVGRSCVTIGPFKSKLEADGVHSAYASEELRAGIRVTQGQVFVGHWVQIRQIPDKATGDAMLQTLHEGGLEDAYLVTDDEEGLKISLGLFSEMAGAERKELQAESMGLSADISPRMRKATVYFVDIGLPPGKGASAIIENYGEDKVLLRDQATCPKTN
jgi:hypothetical protein